MSGLLSSTNSASPYPFTRPCIPPLAPVLADKSRLQPRNRMSAAAIIDTIKARVNEEIDKQESKCTESIERVLGARRDALPSAEWLAEKAREMEQALGEDVGGLLGEYKAFSEEFKKSLIDGVQTVSRIVRNSSEADVQAPWEAVCRLTPLPLSLSCSLACLLDSAVPSRHISSHALLLFLPICALPPALFATPIDVATRMLLPED